MSKFHHKSFSSKDSVIQNKSDRNNRKDKNQLHKTMQQETIKKRELIYTTGAEARETKQGAKALFRRHCNQRVQQRNSIYFHYNKEQDYLQKRQCSENIQRNEREKTKHNKNERSSKIEGRLADERDAVSLGSVCEQVKENDESL